MLRRGLTLSALALTVGCASAPSAPPAAHAKPEEVVLKKAAGPVLPSQQAEPTAKLVSYYSEAEPKPITLETVPAGLASRPITLPAVLEVVDRDNPRVAAAREQVFEAYAQWERAGVLWLPSLRAGVNYNKHEGRIQDVLGSNVETSRGAFYSGLGAGAVGAGSPSVPGIYANFHLTDAIFQPKIAAHVTQARTANAQATTNDFALQAAQAYLELLRAVQDRAIAEEVVKHAQALADLTEAYAKTGEGLESDFDRARTELALRRNELLRSEEAMRVASARLAQILSLDPTVVLEPQEPAVVPIRLVGAEAPLPALVAEALSTRPELQESQALVCEAVRRLEREQYAPLVPSVLLGVSYGEFGAGLGGTVGNFGDRFDGDAMLWWELRNMGYGEAAARRQMRSRLEQARWQQVAVMDLVAREVVETHTQVQLREQQIETAEQTVKIARTSYEKNLDRIRNGQGLPLEALQAIQALAQAQRDYLRAVTDFNTAQFALDRAVGQRKAASLAVSGTAEH